MSHLYIDKVGFEIEGGWNSRPTGFTHDGSVGGIRLPHVGESVSPPYKRMSSVERFVNENYPEEVNESCGLHIHTSFVNNALYSRLMETDFLTQTLEFWKSFGTRHGINSGHRFWKRLRGENRYCTLTVDPMVQAASRGKDSCRYGYLNFCHAFHKTLELRVLPAWSKKDFAYKSIVEWIDFQENFLARNRMSIPVVLSEPLVSERGTPENIVNISHVDADSPPSGPDPHAYRRGANIVANGTMDGRPFHNVPGRIVEFSPDGSGPDADQCELYGEYTDPSTGEVFRWYGWGQEVWNTVRVVV